MTDSISALCELLDASEKADSADYYERLYARVLRELLKLKKHKMTTGHGMSDDFIDYMDFRTAIARGLKGRK